MEFPRGEDPDRFGGGCDIILANRMAEELQPAIGKVYCMDISMRIDAPTIDFYGVMDWAASSILAG